MKNYILTFIEEKGIENDIINYGESKGHFGFDAEMLAEFIANLQEDTKKQIKNNIVYIDFKNGDVMHFFKYILDGIFKQYEF